MNKKKILGLCLVVIGLSIGSYYSLELYNVKRSTTALTKNEIKNYETAPESINSNTDISPPDDQQSKSVQIPTTQVQHQQGEKVALLVIPKINKNFSVYWGTDPKVLKKGVGMFVSDLTTTPAGNGHTVLSGHRDTVFTELGELQENDTLIVKYDNKTYTYQITRHWVTDAEDRTVIVEKDEPTLTLTTCYPFDYVGDAPNRYIIEAKLTSTT
ncbi:class D sortase [Bacillus thuringiensis]